MNLSNLPLYFMTEKTKTKTKQKNKTKQKQEVTFVNEKVNFKASSFANGMNEKKKAETLSFPS